MTSSSSPLESFILSLSLAWPLTHQRCAPSPQTTAAALASQSDEHPLEVCTMADSAGLADVLSRVLYYACEYHPTPDTPRIHQLPSVFIMVNKAPCLTIYLHQWLVRSHISTAAYAMACYLIDRLLLTGYDVNRLVIHKLFAAALACSMKFLDDRVESVRTTAFLVGVSPAEMVNLELVFLDLFDFNLYCTLDDIELFLQATKTILHCTHCYQRWNTSFLP